MNEAFTINGVSLDTLAFMLSDISQSMRAPARRGENTIVPQRHGRIRLLGKKFDANDIVLPLWIVGANPDGSIPVGSNDRIEFFKRRDELLRLVYADPLTLAYTRPDGRTVQAEAEVADVLDFTRRHDDPVAQVNVALEIISAFWEDADTVSQDVSGPTATETVLTEFEGTTAPTNDLLITFFGPANNPKLTHGSRWVQFNGVIDAGRQLRIDTQTWQLGPGSGALWTPDIRLVEQGHAGPWFEIDPATVPFSVTFDHTTGTSVTATIAGRRKYLSP